MKKAPSGQRQKIFLAALIIFALFFCVFKGFVPVLSNTAKTADKSDFETILEKDEERLKFIDGLDSKNIGETEENTVVLRFEGLKHNINLKKFPIEKIYYYKDYSKLNLDEYSRNTLKELKAQGFSDKEALNYVYPGMLKDAEMFLAKIDKDAVDAKVLFYPNKADKFVIKPHREGRKARRDELYADLVKTVLGRRRQAINISTDNVEVGLTAAEARKQTNLIASFSTGYSTSSDDRKHNVKLALERFNGKKLEPGEKISFNETARARTESNGYRMAKIIKAGKFEDGIGGGVCQSSTTLYNAALLADMEIISANNHSLPVSYVDASFDAMVNSGWSDLVFRNTKKTPVYIRTYSTSDKVYVEFYGELLPYKIVRKSVTYEIVPHKDAEVVIDSDGKYSEFVKYSDERVMVSPQKNGLKSKGYLYYYDRKGKLIDQKEIRRDSYAAQNGIIAVGTAKRPPAPPPAPALPESSDDKGIIDTIINWLAG